MQTETIVVRKMEATLSVLLARHYRRVIPGAVEAVYALNQDLSQDGVFLPVGRTIVVPTLPAMLKARTAPAEIVDLFA